MLKNFLVKKAGMKGPVLFGLLNKIWALVSGLITIYLITTYFSSEIQGFYYTFSTILVFQQFLEMGFGVVLVQFISHEWSNLRINSSNKIEGNDSAIFRLASLLRLAIKWYLFLAFAFFFIIGFSGFHFLSLRNEGRLPIFFPWWILVGFTSVSILFLPLRGFLEGSNQIKKSLQFLFYANLFSSLAGWIVIYLGAKLYTIAIIIGTKVIFEGFLLLGAAAPFYRLWDIKSHDHCISWKKDFWPQQWRIGLSWISGFFTFQSFVPILFYFKGPIAAGIAGATLQIFNAVNQLSYSWIQAAGPSFGILYSQKRFADIKKLVRDTKYRSFLGAIFFSAGALLLIVIASYFELPQAKRFADPITIVLILLTACSLQFSNVETVSIRFNKMEPFVLASVSTAVLILLSNIYLGKYYGLWGASLGFFLIVNFVTVPWIHKTYKKRTFEVHSSIPKDFFTAPV